MTPVRLEPVALLSRVKHSTTEPLGSIVYIEGLQIITSKNIAFLSLNIDFVLTNSAGPDEILPYAPFHLGLHCLQ